MTGLAKRGRRAGEGLAGVIELLAALAVRGAYVRPEDAGSGRHSVPVHGRSAGQPAAFAADRVREASNRGWIAPDATTGCLTLTVAGREALRRARSELVSRRALAGTASAQVCPDRAVPGYNLAESPISWLASRKDANGQPMLTEAQVAAGERLRSDMTFAALVPRVTMSWSGMPTSGNGGGSGPGSRDLADNVIAARARVTAALVAVGPEFADILIDVCGHLRGLEDIARAEGWPRRAARLILQRGLSALARHYGLERSPDVGETIARRLRHWGTEDFRPALAPRSANQEA
ncbi:MAG: DUF6456 domain-containing protein [Hyphomicrobiaceae bacterium]